MIKTTKVLTRGRLSYLTYLAVASIFILLSTIFIVFSVKKPSRPQEVTITEPVTVTLYTPEKSVPVGVPLSSVKFREIVWPRNQVPEDAVLDISKVLNYYSLEVISAGPPLRYSQISKDPVVTSLPLSPGMRAVSIEVDETTSVEGFARPGTRVDVTLTFKNDKTKALETRIIVQNARVLSLGGDPTVQPDALKNNKSSPKRTTLTLEVTPEEALIIQTARQTGRLGLLMRAPEDTSVAPVDSVSDRKIVDPNFQAKNKDDNRCISGTVRIGDKNFAIPCDRAGELVPLD
jgi:pilus assembly protein CpaB